MMTIEQRRKIESQLSPEEQSIAKVGRLLKAAVLGMMILGLTWLSAGGGDSGTVQQAAAPASASASVR